MQVSLTSKGNWAKTKRYLHALEKEDYLKILDQCGKMGVEALSEATPKDSGLTAQCWDYDVVSANGNTTITWSNSNLGNGWFPIAISLQYGHGTGTGGYVNGVDYINPAIKPVFDKIAETVWKVVVSL